jgi:hypothetical protein
MENKGNQCEMGICSKCGAQQFLSYKYCNYNGVCNGKIIPIESKENHVQRLYSGRYNSYAEWNGSAWEDKSVSSAYFYSLEKAANNGYYPIVNLRRNEALEWWNKLNVIQQMRYAQNHFTRDDSVNLTGREIEEIWNKEVNGAKVSELMGYNKPNQKQFKPKFSTDSEKVENVIKHFNKKQFKEFNAELFKAYIDKFSQEHKISMLQVLIDDLNVRALVDKSLRS